MMATTQKSKPMQRLTFKILEQWAKDNGWAIERNNRGGPDYGYEFWRVNDQGVGPLDGMTWIERTLVHAYSVMYHEHRNGFSHAVSEDQFRIENN
jgi:hypothetical protein